MFVSSILYSWMKSSILLYTSFVLFTTRPWTPFQVMINVLSCSSKFEQMGVRGKAKSRKKPDSRGVPTSSSYGPSINTKVMVDTHSVALRDLNTRDRLPTEMITEIFRQGLSGTRVEGERFRAFIVRICSLWRYIIINTPTVSVLCELWSNRFFREFSGSFGLSSQPMASAIGNVSDAPR